MRVIVTIAPELFANCVTATLVSVPSVIVSQIVRVTVPSAAAEATLSLVLANVNVVVVGAATTRCVPLNTAALAPVIAAIVTVLPATSPCAVCVVIVATLVVNAALVIVLATCGVTVLMNIRLSVTAAIFSPNMTLNACVACVPTAPGNGIKPDGVGAVLSIMMLLFAFSDPIAIDAGTGVAAVTPEMVTPVGRLMPVTLSF